MVGTSTASGSDACAGSEELDALLRMIEAVAVEAAQEAGNYFLTRCGSTAAQSNKNPVDIVTEVDQHSEKIIRGHIARAFPHHAVLGEEGVEPGAAAATRALQGVSDAEWLWVVDPLDGTLNFVHGMDLYVVSIAVAHRGAVVVGVIYDPHRKETFTARRGGGAFLNGTRIAVPRTDSLLQSILAVGFPSDHLRMRPAMCRGISELAPRTRSLRCTGSACVHLSWLACGRITAFWEVDLNAWDIAAGSLLVQEAGGTVTDTRGEPYSLRVRHVLASNGRIHGELVGALAAARATGFEEAAPT
eukprot:tig00001224_g7641.t1